MNKNISLQIGMILNDIQKDKSYRIIHFISNKSIVVIDAKTSLFNLMVLNMDIIVSNIIDEKWTFNRADNKIVDIDKLTQKQKDKYLAKLRFLKEIDSVYGPSYLGLNSHETKKELNEICFKYNVSKSSCWRLIREYLQSGFDNSVLLYKKRNNGQKQYPLTKLGAKPLIEQGIPLSSATEKQFDEALKRYKSNPDTSFAKEYDRICAKYYSQIVDGVFQVLPSNQRPTYRQFYYYCSKRLNKKDMDIIKTSKQEFRNNKRLLLSESQADVQGPGDCFEMDALEMDIEIVSELNSEQIIGHPILYALIDVYSHVITAISIGFENNSILGMTNCFMNLCDDKTEYCKKYGFLNIDIKLWPSNVLPNRIRVDRGSDFVSKDAERIFNELNITREIVTGGTGSLKGLIEQLWHQLHSSQNGSLNGAGLIRKAFNSNHKKKAVLNIKDITKIVITEVLAFNGIQLENYKLTKDMVKKKIQPIPYQLWNYGVNKYGNPRPIQNKSQYMYTLMTKPKARISRRGVKIDGLYYISDDINFINQMLATDTKSVPFDCRYDERDITNIYYFDSGVLKKASLNMAIKSQVDFVHSTKKERLDYLIKVKELKAQGEQINQTLKSSRVEIIDDIVKEKRDKRSINKCIKNIKENRQIEQNECRKQNSISKKLEDISKSGFDPVNNFIQANQFIRNQEDEKYGIKYDEA